MTQILARLKAAFPAPAALALAAAFALIILLGAAHGDETTAQQLEVRIGRALSRIEGAGQVDVVIRTKAANLNEKAAGYGGKRENETVPCGAVAIAEGADDPYVRMQITQALCALLGLQAAQVDVLSAAGG